MSKKISYDELFFTRLKKEHDVSTFRCNEERLAEFLIAFALNNQDDRISATRLVYWQNTLAGFFTLINDSISTSLINDGDGVKGYRYDFYPALKIARMATHSAYEKRGIGKSMLLEVIATAINISQYAGCRIITVDAKEDAVGFYESFGFVIANNEKDEDDDTILLYKDIKGTLVEE